MKKILFGLLGIVFLFEIIYFNIVFDFLLIGLLLMTAISLGSFFKVKTFGIDKVLISLTIGFGMLGYLIWLSTFYNFSYTSLYLFFSIFIIYIRKDFLYSSILESIKFVKNIYNINAVLLFILILFFMFYTVAASSPINGHDSLAKHIVIPLKILNYTHYDYNIVESIVFGDYALFHI